MYHRQNSSNDNTKPYQTIQLYSLKNKTQDNLYLFQDNKIVGQLNKEGVNVVAILGVFYFVSSPTINEQVFAGMNLQQSPKQFQPFAHQKTLNFLIKNLLSNKNQQFTQLSLTLLINEYPIVNFIIQAYCRAICIKQIKKDHDQNQREILENFSVDVRGNLLDVLVNCLQMHLTLICGQFVQTYGLEKNAKKLQIKFTQTKIEAQIINKRQNFFYSKVNQNSAIRNTKYNNTVETEGTQSLKTSTVETSFINKDPLAATTQFVKCEKCKMIKSRCYCSRRQISSPYHTPNNASKFDKNAINNAISKQLPIVGHVNFLQFKGKCTCHKVFCICRK